MRLETSDPLELIWLAVFRRPARAIVIGLGSLLGFALLGYSVTWAASGARAVLSELDSLASTSVVIRSSDPTIPPEVSSITRVREVPGVVAAGSIVSLGSRRIQPFDVPWESEIEDVPVVAGDQGAVEYLQLTIDGQPLSAATFGLALPQALVGVGVLQQFGEAIEAGGAIRVDGFAFAVAGIITDAKQQADVLFQVFIAQSAAERLWGTDGLPSEIVIRVQPGAAEFVAAHSALLVDRNDPERLFAMYEPEPEQFRSRLGSQLSGLQIGLGVALIIASTGVAAAVATADVLNRRGEIGLRRALGATRALIAGQLLGESALIGLTAGTAGSLLGTIGGSVAALAEGWTPVVPPWLVPAGVALSMAAGAVGGLLPALRAARLDPAAALRTI